MKGYCIYRVKVCKPGMGLNGYGEKKKKSKDFLLLLNYKVGT
jgi:hypothetical protein